METELRFCKKCKRNTIQVCQRILTPREHHFLYKMVGWTIRQGKTVDWKEEKRKASVPAWYCPCCGKTWREVYPPAPGMFVAEFRREDIDEIIRE